MQLRDVEFESVLVLKTRIFKLALAPSFKKNLVPLENRKSKHKGFENFIQFALLPCFNALCK